PDVGEECLATTHRRTLRACRLLARDHDGALETQTAVRVVLVPAIVRAREAGRRTLPVIHEIAQPEDLRVRARTVVQQLRGTRGIEMRHETDVRVVRADAG